VSDVCLSVTYIWPKSRTERPRKTKISTEVGHVTRDSDMHFQGQKAGQLQGRGHICGGLPHSLFTVFFTHLCHMRRPP